MNDLESSRAAELDCSGKMQALEIGLAECQGQLSEKASAEKQCNIDVDPELQASQPAEHKQLKGELEIARAVEREVSNEKQALEAHVAALQGQLAENFPSNHGGTSESSHTSVAGQEATENGQLKDALATALQKSRDLEARVADLDEQLSRHLFPFVWWIGHWG